MILKKAFLLLSIFILFISCKKESKETNSDGFRLTATVRGVPDSTRVYLYEENIEIKIDSAYVINENFKFTGKVDLPTLGYLFFYDSQNNRSDNYKYLFLENKVISIVGEYSDFFNAKVIGSRQTDLMTEYTLISENSTQLNKVSNQLNFLYSYANNQMALNELLYIKKEISKDSLLLFYRKLDSINSNSPKGQELLSYSKAVQIKIGDKFRDISGADINRVQHKLSDYNGKIILLNFWSADCGYCKQQNENEFPKLLQKYYQKDFIIISYCIDLNKKEWEKSIKTKYSNWLNISDFRGMNGVNISKYDITGTPTAFLIDKNGIIINSFNGYFEGENRIKKEIDKLL